MTTCPICLNSPQGNPFCQAPCPNPRNITFTTGSLQMAEAIWGWGSGSDPLAIQCYGRHGRPGQRGFFWQWEMSEAAARDLLSNLESEQQPTAATRRAIRLVKIALRGQT